MVSIFGRIREFDAYTKPLDDFRIKTLTGGAVTIISGSIILLLFVGELRDYLTPEVVEELFVDTSNNDDRLKINFDLLFPRLSCSFLSVDAMDVSGDQQADVQHNVWRVKLDKSGKPISDKPEKHEVGVTTPKPATTTAPNCGSCYGAEDEDYKCCNTCEDVKMAYRRKGWGIMELDKIAQCKSDAWIQSFDSHGQEGCHLYGHISVAKVAGNFHIAPGRTLKERHAHVHDLHSIGPQRFNTTHNIIHLSFGEAYPGKRYPLDDVTATCKHGGTMFQYFVKIVPTTYINIKGEIVTHQFSVTKHEKSVTLDGDGGLPGLFVMYEFSPLMIRLTEKTRSISHFLTSVCVIIGGVFTVASLLDAMIYRSSKAFQKKMDLGKTM